MEGKQKLVVERESTILANLVSITDVIEWKIGKSHMKPSLVMLFKLVIVLFLLTSQVSLPPSRKKPKKNFDLEKKSKSGV